MQAWSLLPCWSLKHFSMLFPFSFLLLSTGAWLCCGWHTSAGLVSTPVRMNHSFPGHMTQQIWWWMWFHGHHWLLPITALLTLLAPLSLVSLIFLYSNLWYWVGILILKKFFRQKRIGENCRVWEIILCPLLKLKKTKNKKPNTKKFTFKEVVS